MRRNGSEWRRGQESEDEEIVEETNEGREMEERKVKTEWAERER